MKNYKYLFIATTLLFLAACQEKDWGSLDNATGKPPVVTNIRVENAPGGAVIYYTLPNTGSVTYVKAVYKLQNGTEKAIISSAFKNNILIEGLSDTLVHQVQLYTVNKSEVVSDPTTVSIQPKKPPIVSIYESLQVKEDFGGINLRFENPLKKEVVLYALMKDSTNIWKSLDRLYTQAESRSYNIRNMKPVSTDFAFFFKDLWGNFSDTLYSKLTPIYEEEINKKLWKLYKLPNDHNTNYWSGLEIHKLWDTYVGCNTCRYLANDIPVPDIPNWFTIDLGQTVTLSRIKINQYTSAGYAYNTGAPRRFEIWGIQNAPPPDGSWDGWVHLLNCESIKPSGMGIGTVTAEDLSYASAGESFDFPPGTPPMRYFRFKLLETWDKRNNLHLAEITLWGQAIK